MVMDLKDDNSDYGNTVFIKLAPRIHKAVCCRDVLGAVTQYHQIL